VRPVGVDGAQLHWKHDRRPVCALATLGTFGRMELSSQAELFTTAVSMMAESPGAVQQRINRAYLSALSKVSPDEVTEEFRPRVAALISRLGATPMTRTMLTDDEGAAVAKEVVALAFELCHHDWAAD
jgi:hypothetical protein